jgi:2-oxoacid:acceptor oxidoreductase gamma subunit (pyruvate/2-ketoisovalerate family)
MFGIERRGAPVTAYLRFDDSFIWEKSRVYHPDFIIVTDQVIANNKSTYLGLKKNGTIIANSSEASAIYNLSSARVLGCVDATKIAVEEMGREITNTCLLGAFIAVTELVSLGALFSTFERYFSGEILTLNKRCAQRGFEESILNNSH